MTTKKLILLLTTLLLTWTATYTYGQWTSDTISFENPTTKITINSTSGNLWQIGRPHKTFLDTAFTPKKAILTDTINFYSKNDTSSFMYVIQNTSTPGCPTCVNFMHKFDMDTLGDKGFIDASYNGGISWSFVKDTTFLSSPISYFHWGQDCRFFSSSSCIILSTHNPIISGNSTDWISSNFCWQWADTLTVVPDSLILRFTFISDSITKNKDGWMIDNIITNSTTSCPLGIKDNFTELDVKVSPNPFSSSTNLTAKSADLTVTIYNLCGQPVKQIKTNYRQTVLNRDNLPSGLYFLRVTKDNKVVASDKLVIVDN